MPSGRTASARAWLASAPALSTGSRAPPVRCQGQAWLVSGFVASSRPYAGRRSGSQQCSHRRVRRRRQTRWPSCAATWRALRFVIGQIREIEAARLERLEQHPQQGAHAMVRRLAQVIGVGVETADMLGHEILSPNLRDRRAVARYAGLTGAPDESGAWRREKGLARPAPGSEQGAGNSRVPHGTSPWAEGPRGMIQLAWRFLIFQKDSALAQ